MLKGGGSVRGTIIGETEEEFEVRLAGGGTMRVARDAVEEVRKSQGEEGPDPVPGNARQQYEKLRKESGEGDAGRHMELAAFCLKNRLYSEAFDELGKAEKTDPSRKSQVERKRKEVEAAHGMALFGRVSRQMAAKRYDAARAAAVELTRLYPGTEAARRGEELVASTARRDEIRQILESVAALGPGREDELRRQVLALAVKPGDASYQALVRLLKTKRVAARSSAAEALGLRGDPGAVQPLLGTATSDADIGVRRAAVRALGQLPVEKGAEKLIPLLRARHPGLRTDVVETLAAIGDPAAAKGLVRLLADKDEEVRAAAIRAVADLQVEEAVRPLASLLVSEGADVRGTVIDALGTIGEESAVPYLVRDFEEEEDALRVQIIAALGSIGGKAGAGVLVRMLRRGEKGTGSRALKPGLAEAVVEALGEIEKEEGAREGPEDYLVRYGLKHSQARVRAKTVEVLGSMGGNASMKALEGMLGDPSREVRETAAGAIREIRERRKRTMKVTQPSDNG